MNYISQQLEAVTDSQEPAMDFSLCQFDRIAEVQKAGGRIEFEAWSPYLMDHNMSSGELFKDNLTPTDEIGIALIADLRKVFTQAGLVVLYDEYNSGMPNNSDAYGRPFGGGPQLDFTQDARVKFKSSIEEVLRDQNIIREGDEDQKDFMLVSESEKMKDAEILVERLEGLGKIERKEDGSIYFVDPTNTDENCRRITLKNRYDKWMCEALDASAFLNPENFETTHLVILPKEFKSQQNKVWVILRTLGIQPDNYHNIFFDSDQLTRDEAVEQLNAKLKEAGIVVPA